MNTRTKRALKIGILKTGIVVSIVTLFLGSGTQRAHAQTIACTLDNVEQRLTYSFAENWEIDPVSIPNSISCFRLKKKAVRVAKRLVKKKGEIEAANYLGMTQHEIKKELTCQQVADRLNSLPWAPDLRRALGVAVADIYLYDDQGELEQFINNAKVPCFWQVLDQE